MNRSYRCRSLLYGVAVAVICWTAASGVLATDWVQVGDPGNGPDTTGFGSVGYSYAIGKYEVTQAEYVDFLNHVAADDTNQVYTPHTKHGIGIVRSGVSGSYVYSVAPPAVGMGPNGTDFRYDTKPVNFVSFFDSIRYANWLHNGKPYGAQDASTTEDGAYTLLGSTALAVGNDPINGIHGRNAGAKYWLPSEDEWFKASYYDPTLNDGLGGYYYYPTSSFTVPNNNLPTDDTGNSANFKVDGSGTTGQGDYFPLTDVGAYELSPSPSGTFDQAGNLFEWTEDPILSWSKRITRGGSWHNTSSHLDRGRQDTGPYWTLEDGTIGFRIATIPEPGTSLLLGIAALAGLFTLAWRKRGR